MEDSRSAEGFRIKERLTMVGVELVTFKSKQHYVDRLTTMWIASIKVLVKMGTPQCRKSSLGW